MWESLQFGNAGNRTQDCCSEAMACYHFKFSHTTSPGLQCVVWTTVKPQKIFLNLIYSRSFFRVGGAHFRFLFRLEAKQSETEVVWLRFCFISSKFHLFRSLSLKISIYFALFVGKTYYDKKWLFFLGNWSVKGLSYKIKMFNNMFYVIYSFFILFWDTPEELKIWNKNDNGAFTLSQSREAVPLK